MLGRSRSSKSIVIAAVVLYGASLAIAWQQLSARADKRTKLMLEAAETGYASVIYGEIEAALRNTGGAIINFFGHKFEAHSIEQMERIAKIFNVDEINLVNREGVAISSNIRAIVGDDYKKNPLTRQFLDLTNSTTSLVSQPFRHGVANPDMYCFYFGLAFPDKKGLLQLGISVERLRQNMYAYSEEEADRILRNWHFSVTGWYERVKDGEDFKPGRLFRRFDTVTGEMAIGRNFEFEHYRYAAFLPISYCNAARNGAFAVIALVLAALVGIFVFILIRLARASQRITAMHAAAQKRTAEDLAISRTIQMSVLPSSDGAFMDYLEFSFFAETFPAREVGGDFYDFYPISGGRLVFLVADVSGKGIPGAMFMMEAKNVLKNCLVANSDIADAVTEANARLCAGNKAEFFVTAWIGALDPRTGEMEYVNAGHNRPFVRRTDGTVEKIAGKGGRFIGMFEDAKYRAHILKFNPGDGLYLYTDGIPEAMNAAGEQFGEKRLCDVIAEGKRRMPDVIGEFVGNAEPSDDWTGLWLRWHGAPSRESREFACSEASLGGAVEFIRSCLNGVNAKPVASLLNAADEAVSNIVNYSGSKEFRVTVERSCDRMRVTLSDAGEPYNPLLHADPDVHATIENRPVGGLGLVMVKRLVNRVTYERRENRNVLVLVKRF